MVGIYVAPPLIAMTTRERSTRRWGMVGYLAGVAGRAAVARTTQERGQHRLRRHHAGGRIDHRKPHLDGIVALLALQRVVVHDRATHLGVDVDRRDGDEAEALVVEPRELVGDHLAERLAEPRGALDATTIVEPRSPGPAPLRSHGNYDT